MHNFFVVALKPFKVWRSLFNPFKIELKWLEGDYTQRYVDDCDATGYFGISFKP